MWPDIVLPPEFWFFMTLAVLLAFWPLWGARVSAFFGRLEERRRDAELQAMYDRSNPNAHFRQTVDAINVSFSETGKADVPATIAVAGGDGQTNVVRRLLTDPLTAKVTDRFDNPVPAAVVDWTTAGAGNLGAKQSTTNTDGLTTNAYTLGGVVGPESIVASIGTAIATFSAQATPAKPTSIAASAGGGQNANTNSSLASPLVASWSA